MSNTPEQIAKYGYTESQLNNLRDNFGLPQVLLINTKLENHMKDQNKTDDYEMYYCKWLQIQELAKELSPPELDVDEKKRTTTHKRKGENKSR